MSLEVMAPNGDVANANGAMFEEEEAMPAENGTSQRHDHFTIILEFCVETLCSVRDCAVHSEANSLTGVSMDGVDEHAPAAPAADKLNGDAAAAEVPARKVPERMYFLRLPKPDLSDLQMDKQRLDTEFTQYKEACNRALAAAKLANEHRYQRREEYNSSHQQFNATKAERDGLLNRLRPLREANRQVTDRRNVINQQKAGLPASSVAELEAKIQELEWKQAHETMDRRTENALIADIKKLSKSRADVARFEEQYQQVWLTRAHQQSTCMQLQLCFALSAIARAMWACNHLRMPHHIAAPSTLVAAQRTAVLRRQWPVHSASCTAFTART